MKDTLKCPNCGADRYSPYCNHSTKRKVGKGHKLSTKYICLRCGSVFGRRMYGDAFLIASQGRIK